MALHDAPTQKTPEGIAVVVAVSLASFIFLFTQPKESDVALSAKRK
ncbi:hypothetical protein JCM10914A_43940 [Paenibacillus sp. JCM 10914]|nr:hypothetical protein [Paenibacillus sp. JCM 10914]